MSEVVWESAGWYRMHGYKARVQKLDSGQTRTVYEHREVMEAILGRKLMSDETVHHRDENKLNNEPANLEVMSRAAHAKEHAERVPLLKLTCIGCKRPFERRGNFERHNRKQGKRGPYCSKSCAVRSRYARKAK